MFKPQKFQVMSSRNVSKRKNPKFKFVRPKVVVTARPAEEPEQVSEDGADNVTAPN